LASSARPSATLQAKQIDDLVQLDAALGGRRPAQAVGQIAAHGQVRKQAALLEHIADAPALRRQIEAALRIEHRHALDFDPARVRPRQTGQQIDQAGLAGAGAAEQRDDAVGRAGKLGIDLEGAQTLGDRDLDHG